MEHHMAVKMNVPRVTLRKSSKTRVREGAINGYLGILLVRRNLPERLITVSSVACPWLCIEGDERHLVDVKGMRLDGRIEKIPLFDRSSLDDDVGNRRAGAL